MISELETVSGIGEKTRVQLLKAFKSVQRVSYAKIDELEQVIGKSKAMKVYNYFNSKTSLKFKLLSFIFFATLMCFGQDKLPENPRVGLVLSGGGAKGLAHIGVLKVMDSLELGIDYIGGTSMGAAVGGLYASGYTKAIRFNLRKLI